VLFGSCCNDILKTSYLYKLINSVVKQYGRSPLQVSLSCAAGSAVYMIGTGNLSFALLGALWLFRARIPDELTDDS
jgi:hypothetical protein